METVSMVAAAISGLVAAAIATGPGRRFVVRNLGHGRALCRILVVLFGTVGGLGLLAHLSRSEWVHGAVTIAELLLLASATVLVLQARIVPTHTTRPGRILAIGAHPDDLELACGGSLARLIDRGQEVHALVMSQGGKGGTAELRVSEARDGARFLKFTSLDIHDFPDTHLGLAEVELTKAIEAAIHRVQPDLILTHSVHDQHQDHHAVHLATLRAGRKHHSILCCESPSVTPDFRPSVFVDITDYMDVKVEAVLAHKGQGGKSYVAPDRVHGVATFRGHQGKLPRAEAFEAVRLLSSVSGVF